MYFEWNNPYKWRGRWMWADWLDDTDTNLFELIFIRPMMYAIIPLMIVVTSILLPVHLLFCVKLGERPSSAG